MTTSNQKHNDIQSVLRSYGGPSKERTPHYDQLKAQLLRSEYFAAAENSQEQDREQARTGVTFSWVGLLQRLSVATVPAVALVLIIAILVSNYSPLTAKQVLAKAADVLEASTTTGQVHYSKIHSQIFYDGVTDNYNDTTSETWLNLATLDSRTTVYTRDGRLLEDIAVLDQGREMYRAPNTIWAELYAGPMVEGPGVEPGGPVEQKLAQNPQVTGLGSGGFGGGSGMGGGEVDSSSFSACAEGSPEPCEDVILNDYVPTGFVGAFVGEDDETLIGGLYGLTYEKDPKVRAEMLRTLGESPRAKMLGELEWHGRKVYGVAVKYWTLPQRDTFYIDTETYALVGIETVNKGGGIWAGGLDMKIVMEVLDESYSEDSGAISTQGLEPYQDPYMQLIQDLEFDPNAEIIIPPEGVIPE